MSHPFSESLSPWRARRGWREDGAWFWRVLLAWLAWLAWPTLVGAEWQAGEGHRRLVVQPAGDPSRPVGFRLRAASETGVAFTNVLGERASLTNHIYLNGSGVALADVNGDGWVDLYLCRLEGANALYLNRGGWRFDEVTAASGVGCDGQYSTGAVFADLDGDGDEDLLVGGVGRGVRAFVNDGGGRFAEVTGKAGVGSEETPMSLAVADVDGDGKLDFYAANYRSWTMRDAFNLPISVRMVDGKPTVTRVFGRPVSDPDLRGRLTVRENGGLLEHGEVDVLYRNEGGGRFRRVPVDGPAFRDALDRPLPGPLFEWGLGAAFRDLDGDGLPDLYVCNDFHSLDRLWMNRGDGSFRAAPPAALRKGSWFGMGVDFGDLDRDGHDDFLVVDMLSRDPVKRQVQVGSHMRRDHPPGRVDDRPEYSRNTMFWGRGDGTWQEAALASGLHATEWSWTPVFLDVDLDGFEDVLVTTGFERDVQDADVAARLEEARRRESIPDARALEMRREFPPLREPNLAFRNLGGRRFEDASAAWGFDHAGISQGMALADLDNDGDLDAMVNNLNGPAWLLENVGVGPRVAVRLAGPPGNPVGIGARIRLVGGAVRQEQEMQGGGRYLSADAPQRVFATGGRVEGLSLEVEWPGPGRRRSVVRGVVPNSIYEVRFDGAVPSRESGAVRGVHGPASDSLFLDVSTRLGHRHVELVHDDFERQPLLPRKLSQLGPCVAWLDVDGDGRDELFVGTGAGGSLAGHRVAPDGSWSPLPQEPWAAPVPVDHGGIVGWRSAPGIGSVLAAVALHESAAPDGPALIEYPCGASRPSAHVFGWPSSAGALALGIDRKGGALLFVAGRNLPGRYPEPSSSLLLRPGAGGWQTDAGLSRALEGVGMVTGAVWTDLDVDGQAELVLACDWGTPRVFALVPDGLRERTRDWGLDSLSGCWNAVVSGDFDGDGRPDLVFANWGTNTRHEPYRGDRGIRLYHGDFAGRGSVDIVEAWHHPARGWLPWRVHSELAPALPLVAARFPTHRALAAADIPGLLGALASGTRHVEARVFESMLMLNRVATGGRFEARALPREAQMAPAMGMAVADFDGDGREDLFVAQNFFANDTTTERYDAGFGLVLMGDGAGGLAPMSAVASGVRLLGEQRGVAVSDYNGDGRPDVAVGQNAGPTAVLENRGGRPGLRVVLRGPAGNPDGIGTRLRLVLEGGGAGPLREVQAGSGQGSQSSTAIVLGMAREAEALEVGWPGAAPRRLALPKGARRVVVRHPDHVEVVP